MWFWWFLFCCDLLLPILMLVCGRLMYKRPPKKINALMGYRTSRSMKNKDTWTFAHHYSGKLWWKLGWILLVPSALFHLPLYGKPDDTIGLFCLLLVTVQLIVLIGSVVLTERALKRTFTDDGVRKSCDAAPRMTK